MRYALILASALLAMAGCTIQRAIVANEARHDMVGMSKEQVLGCMGLPAGKDIEGSIEVWGYPSGGSSSTFSSAQAYGTGTGTATGMATGNLYTGTYNGSSSATGFGSSFTTHRYCVVNVVFRGNLVSAVNYQGNTGGLITQGEECAYAVQNCTGQPAPSATSIAAPAAPPGTAPVTAPGSVACKLNDGNTTMLPASECTAWGGTIM